MRPNIFSIAILVLIVPLFGCRPERPGDTVGVVKFATGQAELERGGKRTPLKVDERFGTGDMIRTGPKGVVVAALKNNVAEVEIQPNAVFSIDEFSAERKTMSLQKGNLWLRVNKKHANETFTLHSPASVASVRGTKFWTFHFLDLHGTCVCQGAVDFKIKGQRYHKSHAKDYVLFTRGEKTVVVTPAELKQIFGPIDAHHHSLLDKSPLGPKQDATPEQIKKLTALVEKKLKEVR